MAAYLVCLLLHLVTALCDYTTPGASGDSFSLLLGAYGDDLWHRDLPLTLLFLSELVLAFIQFLRLLCFFIFSSSVYCQVLSQLLLHLLFFFSPEFRDPASVEGFHHFLRFVSLPWRANYCLHLTSHVLGKSFNVVVFVFELKKCWSWQKITIYNQYLIVIILYSNIKTSEMVLAV